MGHTALSATQSEPGRCDPDSSQSFPIKLEEFPAGVDETGSAIDDIDNDLGAV